MPNCHPAKSFGPLITKDSMLPPNGPLVWIDWAEVTEQPESDKRERDGDVLHAPPHFEAAASFEASKRTVVDEPDSIHDPPPIRGSGK